MNERFTGLAIIVTLILMSSSTSSAQFPFDTTGRWRLFHATELGIDTLPKPNISAKSVYFLTKELGYLFADVPYRTTDGGRSWATLSSPVSVPHQFFAEGYCVGYNATISRDSGLSWQKIPIPFADTARHEKPLVAVAMSRQRLAVLYARHAVSGGVEVPKDPLRLAWTTDGGSTWTLPDSVDTPGASSIAGVKLTGGLPDYPGAVGHIYRWQCIAPHPDSNILIVVLHDIALRTDGADRVFYVGRINIDSGSVRWGKIPLSENELGASVGFDRFSLPLLPRFPTPDVGYMIGARKEGTTTYRDDLWRTSDGGITWDSMGRIPPGITGTDVTILDADRLVCDGWESSDRGTTWQCWRNRYAGRKFQAIDSETYVVGGDGSFFARTDDAGVHWRTNGSGALVTAATAAGGHLYIADDQGSFLASSDSAEHWQNRSTMLPSSVYHIQGIALVDSNTNATELMAVGFVAQRTCENPTNILLHSTDGGGSWQIRSTISELQGDVRSVSLQMLEAPSSGRRYLFLESPVGRFFSIDSGLAWQRIVLPDTVPQDPLQLNAEYWIGYRQVAPDTGVVMITENGGETWRSTTPLLYPTPTHSAPGFLAAPGPGLFRMISGDDVGTENYLLLSSNDTGSTWQTRRVGNYDKYRSFIWLDTGVVYLVNASALYVSWQGGQGFAPLVDYSSTVVNGGDFFLRDSAYLFLVGRGGAVGRWRIGGEARTSSVPLLVERPQQQLRVVQSARGAVVLQATLSDASLNSEATLVVVDLQGREVLRRKRAVGTTRFEWVVNEASEFPNGVYLIRLSCNGEVLLGEFTIVR